MSLKSLNVKFCINISLKIKLLTNLCLNEKKWRKNRMPAASNIYRNVNVSNALIPEESNIFSIWNLRWRGYTGATPISRSRYPFCILRAINVQTLLGLGVLFSYCVIYKFTPSNFRVRFDFSKKHVRLGLIRFFQMEFSSTKRRQNTMNKKSILKF